MRDLIITLIVFGSVPFILSRPYIGIYIWSWLGYMNPHRLSWGFATTMPFAQIIAIVMILSLLFSKEPKKIPWTRESIVLLIFIFWMLITTFFALNPEGAWFQWDKVWKIQLMTFLTLIVINDQKKLHYLVWVIVLSLGFYGVKGGFFTIVTGGNYKVWGPPGTFIGGNNEIGLALIMIVPLMRYLQLTSKQVWIRWSMIIFMMLTLAAIAGTQSRGALLGVAAMLFFLFMKSRKKFVFGTIMVCAVIALLSFMPESWYERMDTIKTYEEDKSATGRLNSWGFALNLALDRPLVGGGFETFRGWIFSKYAPDPSDFHDAHSIYFEILGEHGFVGLGLFLLLAFFTWRTASWCAKMAKNHQELSQIRDLNLMVQVSLVGYAVSGAFLGLAYFDLYYHLIAIVVISKVLVQRHLEANTQGSESKVSMSKQVQRGGSNS